MGKESCSNRMKESFTRIYYAQLIALDSFCEYWYNLNDYCKPRRGY